MLIQYASISIRQVYCKHFMSLSHTNYVNRRKCLLQSCGKLLFVSVCMHTKECKIRIYNSVIFALMLRSALYFLKDMHAYWIEGFVQSICLIYENISIMRNIYYIYFAVVGGLLSAHLLSKRAQVPVSPEWPCEGPLLTLATEIATKLLPGKWNHQ